MTTRQREDLMRAFADKEYRDAYVEANIETGVAFQIKANRLARGLTQEQLGRLAGMRQTAISRLEGSGEGLPKIDTLVRLASAFDAALMVRFVRFGELADWTISLGDRDLSVPKFDDEVRQSGGSTCSNVVVKMADYRPDEANPIPRHEGSTTSNLLAQAGS